MWFEISIISTIVVIGMIYFGHFEEMTPKWKRVLKFIAYTTGLCLISYFFGRTWFFVVLGMMLSLVVIVHGWYLPTKKGINGLTCEPRDKYYEFRGWSEKIPLEKKK